MVLAKMVGNTFSVKRIVSGNSFLTAISRCSSVRFLRLQTEKEYQDERPFFLWAARTLLVDRPIDQSAYAVFVNFLPEKNFPHEIWLRKGVGVSPCSNHAERFHEPVKALIQ
jgi:hypothetical protein